MHIRYIASNAKGGVSAVLTPKTLIVGPSGSGKSAVLDGLSLALTGTATDIYGRDVMKKDADLVAALAPGHEGMLFANALLSDGREVSWRVGEKGAKKVQHNFPPDVLDGNNLDAVFPLRAALEVACGGVDKARNFFLRNASAISMDDVYAAIDTSLHSHFRDVLVGCGVDLNAPPADKLLAVTAKAKQKAKKGKDKASAQKSVAKAISGDLEPLPPAETQKAVTAEHKTAKEALEKLVAAQAAAHTVEAQRQQVQVLQGQLQDTRNGITNTQASLQQADATLATLEKPSSVDDNVNATMVVLKNLADAEQRKWAEYTAAYQNAQQTGQGLPEAPRPLLCPVCQLDSPEFGHFFKRHQAGEQFIQKALTDAKPYYEALAYREQLHTVLTNYQVQEQALLAQITALGHAIAAGNQHGPSEADMSAARERVGRAEAELLRIEGLKASHEQAKKAKGVATDAAKEGDAWGELYDACREAVKTLLDASIQRFVGAVQSYLPPTDQFALLLHDDDKQVCRFGLKREWGVDIAMSGAEWARVLAAVAAASCKPDGRLKIIVPQDKAFDSVTLFHTLQAFSNIPEQVIVASAVWPMVVENGVPRYAVPEGWSVINTANNEHRTGQP